MSKSTMFSTGDRIFWKNDEGKEVRCYYKSSHPGAGDRVLIELSRDAYLVVDRSTIRKARTCNCHLWPQLYR